MKDIKRVGTLTNVVLRTVVFTAVAVLVVGCSESRGAKPPSTMVVRQAMNELERDRVPGTVDDVWAEPMYDTVKVPGQLDRKGIYYRKAHKTLVEIRPGRYQLQEFPNDRVEPDGSEQFAAPNDTMGEK